MEALAARAACSWLLMAALPQVQGQTSSTTVSQVSTVVPQTSSTMTTTSMPCIRTSSKYTPVLTNVTSTSQIDYGACQASCALTDGCEHFSWELATLSCTYSSRLATISPAYGFTAGKARCPTPAPTPPNPCLSEVASNGFPGLDADASNAAWSQGVQPSKLMCWPTDSTTGALENCAYTVIEDTENSWPGVCEQLSQQSLSAGQTCETHCSSNPTCASFQLGYDESCWQGLGYNCYIRPGFKPVRAQRFQHGQVRVLQDLKGWQVFGLSLAWTINGDGYFTESQQAVEHCKMACYSDIKCDYWSYSIWYGCWVEDVTKHTVAYPLTLNDMTRDSNFAKSSIAGEYIQHICDPSYVEPGTTPTQIPTPFCALDGYQLYPLDTAASVQVVANPLQCQVLCQQSSNCSFFSFFHQTGRCHLQASESEMQYASDSTCGPKNCPITTPSPLASCAHHPSCIQAGFTGICCPNLDGAVLDCCAVTNTDAPDSDMVWGHDATTTFAQVGASAGATSQLHVSMNMGNLTFSELSADAQGKLETTIAERLGEVTSAGVSDMSSNSQRVTLSDGTTTTVRRLQGTTVTTQGTIISAILDTGDIHGVYSALTAPYFDSLVSKDVRDTVGMGSAIKCYGVPCNNAGTWLNLTDVTVTYYNPDDAPQESWFSRWWMALLALALVLCGLCIICGAWRSSRTPKIGRKVDLETDRSPDNFSAEVEDPLLHLADDGLPTGGIHDVGDQQLPFPEAGLPNMHQVPFPEAGLPKEHGRPQEHVDIRLGQATVP